MNSSEFWNFQVWNKFVLFICCVSCHSILCIRYTCMRCKLYSLIPFVLIECKVKIKLLYDMLVLNKSFHVKHVNINEFDMLWAVNSGYIPFMLLCLSVTLFEALRRVAWWMNHILFYLPYHICLNNNGFKQTSILFLKCKDCSINLHLIRSGMRVFLIFMEFRNSCLIFNSYLVPQNLQNVWLILMFFFCQSLSCRLGSETFCVN